MPTFSEIIENQRVAETNRGTPLSKAIVKATRPRSEGPLYFTSELFLPRTDMAARRRSGTPSKVYQWLGPRCRHKVRRKHFANRPLVLQGGVKKCEIWPRVSKPVAFDGL